MKLENSVPDSTIIMTKDGTTQEYLEFPDSDDVDCFRGHKK